MNMTKYWLNLKQKIILKHFNQNTVDKSTSEKIHCLHNTKTHSIYNKKFVLFVKNMFKLIQKAFDYLLFLYLILYFLI